MQNYAKLFMCIYWYDSWSFIAIVSKMGDRGPTNFVSNIDNYNISYLKSSKIPSPYFLIPRPYFLYETLSDTTVSTIKTPKFYFY